MKYLNFGTKFLLLLAMFPISMRAQQTERLTLSLKEAQEVALQNNFQRKNALIDVEIAKKKVWETTAIGLPQVSAGVDFSLRLDSIPMLPFGPINPITGKPTMVAIGEKANATFKVSASQLVFSGPYIVGLQATKAYKSLSENMLTKTDRDIKSNIASAYYTVLLLQETSAVLDSSTQNLKQVLSDTRAMQKAGFIEEIASDQVSVSLSMVENSAKETSQMAQSAKNLLKFQMGLEGDRQIELTDKLDDMLKDFAPFIGGGANLDPEKNIDLQLVANQITISNLQVKLEKSKFLPDVAAFVSYQQLANEPAINFSPKAIAGASLSLPIFSSGMRRSRVQQAQMQLDKSRNSYEQVRQSLEMELADATAQITLAWDKYQSQKANMELAKKVYNNYRIKYTKGVSSQQDMIQANDKYLQAVGSYTSAVVALFNARLRVDKVLGNL
jgi:outer membrane protein TolC